MQFRRKRLLYGDMLYHVNYEWYGKVPTNDQWCINEMDMIMRLSPTDGGTRYCVRKDW